MSGGSSNVVSIKYAAALVRPFFVVVLIGDARYKYVGQGTALALLLGLPVLVLISIFALVRW